MVLLWWIESSGARASLKPDMPLETIYIARHGFRQGFNVPKSASSLLHALPDSS